MLFIYFGLFFLYFLGFGFLMSDGMRYAEERGISSLGNTIRVFLVSITWPISVPVCIIAYRNRKKDVQ